MDLLPNDVLKLIFGLLSSKTRATICSVSKIFCSLSLEVSTAYWPTNCQAIQIPLLDKIYISNKDKKSILRDYHLTVRMKHSELIRIDLACKVGSADATCSNIGSGNPN